MTFETTTIEWTGERAPFAKAFIAAQRATEAVKKGAQNPAFKSKYADLSEVVDALVPALNANGVGVLQFPAFDGELVSVATTLLHESGSSVTSTLHLRPSKLDPQGVGSAITYGRRYSLLAMVGAAPEDDDGNAASGPRQTARKSSAQAKRDGDDARIKAEIEAIASLEALDGWARDFERHTATLPIGWLDPVRDMIEHRRNDLIEAART